MGENGWDEEACENEGGAEAEGETWGASAVSQQGASTVDDEEEVKMKKVRFAAGTKGRSDRKAWMRKLKMESWERAEAGDAAGISGCNGYGWRVGNARTELNVWKSAGYLSATSGHGLCTEYLQLVGV